MVREATLPTLYIVRTPELLVGASCRPCGSPSGNLHLELFRQREPAKSGLLPNSAAMYPGGGRDPRLGE